jgi:anti-sigma-K factor RskA
MTAISPEERDPLAAEFALGVLDGEGLTAARSLLRQDAEFRASVARWTGRLAPLLDEVSSVTPPAHLWQAIESQLEPRTAAGTIAPRPANDNVDRLRRRVGMWQGATAAATALAASLALVVTTRPPPTPVSQPIEQAPSDGLPTTVPARPPAAQDAQPPMIAMLSDEQQKAGMLVASWDPAKRRLTLVAAGAMPSDPERSNELWVIPADGKPRSLGVVPRPRMHLDLSDAIARQMHDGVTLAVSIEPIGGSPTGGPTGAVIASGKLEDA